MNESKSGPARVVVITGASRGIGLGVACLLAAQRVPMMLTARGKERLLRVRDALREGGATVDALACDTADETAMASAFDAACAMGPLGAVLNNAGVLEPIGPIRDLCVEDFDRHLRTNVTGVMVGIQQALVHRNEVAPLRIVNVSSGAAFHGYRGWGAYCSSKAAVNLLTEVAHEETDDEVIVTAVAPGVIETRMQRIIRGTDESRFPDVQKFHALADSGAILHPVDAAPPLDWLLRRAPARMSGKVVDVRDPGFSRQVPEVDPSMIAVARRWFDALEED